MNQNKPISLPIILGTLIVGLSIIGGTFIVANTFYKVKALSNVISVTGSTEKIVKSDTVKWVSGFSRNVGGDNLKEGSAEMKKDLGVVAGYFKEYGIPETEITVQPMTMTAVCESQNNVFYDKFGNQSCGGNRVTGYTFKQDVVVQSGDVDKVTKLSQDASDALIAKGVIFSSQNLEYYYNKLSELRVELLSEATKNAKTRAEKIVESTGGKIGFLQSASMGVFQVTAKNAIDFSDYGYYDTSSIEKKVTAVVRASFILQ